MYKSLCILFTFVSFSSRGQYLNDTSFHGADISSYNSVMATDTGYFVSGSLFRQSNNLGKEAFVGYWSKDGTPEIIFNSYESDNNQSLYNSYSKLNINYDGNFILSYFNCGNGNCYPRLKEITTDGTVLNDISFQPIYDSMGLDGYSYNNMIQKEYDSSYIILSSASDSSLISPTNYTNGVPYIHLDKNFNVLDTIFFLHPTHSFSYSSGDIIELDGGRILVMIRAQNQGVTNESHVVFKILDKEGNILETNYFNDGQKATMPLGLVRTSDDGYMFTYMQGFTNGNTWYYKNKLAKLNSDFTLDWIGRTDVRDTLNLAARNLQQEIKKTHDGNYIIVGGGSEPNGPALSAMLNKFDETGNNLWRRYLYKVENDPNVVGGPTVTMKDVIQKADSGFVMVGEIQNYEANDQFQKGYIVETNCLGFMGEPAAASSHTVLDSFQIEFYNTSIQAGSYEWYFGDGDTLETTEFEDTLTHTYTGEGPFTVTLIANGCGNERDTISFDVYPETFEDTTIIVDVPGNFTFYPNPVLSGQDIFFYMNALNSSEGTVECDIIDLNGKKIRSFELSPNAGTYQIKNNLSKGLYFMQVNQGNKQLHCSKLEVI